MALADPGIPSLFADQRASRSLTAVGKPFPPSSSRNDSVCLTFVGSARNPLFRSRFVALCGARPLLSTTHRPSQPLLHLEPRGHPCHAHQGSALKMKLWEGVLSPDLQQCPRAWPCGQDLAALGGPWTAGLLLSGLRPWPVLVEAGPAASLPTWDSQACAVQ